MHNLSQLLEVNLITFFYFTLDILSQITRINSILKVIILNCNVNGKIENSDDKGERDGGGDFDNE